MRNKNGMPEKSCPSKKTNVPECKFDSSQAYICITYKEIVQMSDEPKNDR